MKWHPSEMHWMHRMHLPHVHAIHLHPIHWLGKHPLVLALLIVFPELATWLPKQMIDG